MVLACSDDPTENRPALREEPAALESVPFGAVGPGKLVFRRTWLHVDGRPSRSKTLYVIDGNQQRTWGALPETSVEIGLVSALPDGSRAVIGSWSLFGPESSLRLGVLDEQVFQELTPLVAANAHAVAFTPDGDHMVYRGSYNSGGDEALFRQEVTAGAPRAQVFPKQANAPTAGSSCTSSLLNIRGPFSVAVSGAIVMTCLDSAIYILDPDADVARLLYDAPGPRDIVRVWAPAWSPDGGRVAFVEATPGDAGYAFAIRVVEPDGRGPETVATIETPGWESDAYLCWMPAGDRIAFTVPRESISLIYIARIETGQVVQITSAPMVRDDMLTCTA